MEENIENEEQVCDECAQAIAELNLLYDTMRYLLEYTSIRKRIRTGCGELVPGQLDQILRKSKDLDRN